LDEQLQGWRMTEKCMRTRAVAVSARHEHHHQVAGLRLREFDAVRQQIERLAKGADYGRDLARHAIHAVTDDNRVVLANDLTEISRRSQMVMQAAVGHKHDLSARDLAIDNTAHIDARFADEIPTEFDDEPRVGQFTRSAIDQLRDIDADG